MEVLESSRAEMEFWMVFTAASRGSVLEEEAAFLSSPRISTVFSAMTRLFSILPKVSPFLWMSWVAESWMPGMLTCDCVSADFMRTVVVAS